MGRGFLCFRLKSEAKQTNIEKIDFPWFRNYEYMLSTAVQDGNIVGVKTIQQEYIININKSYCVHPYKHRPLLHTAVLSRQKSMVEFLLTVDGIDVDVGYTFKAITPLLEASQWNMTAIVEVLANDNRVDLYATDQRGRSALYFAVINRDFTSITVLLQNMAKRPSEHQVLSSDLESARTLCEGKAQILELIDTIEANSALPRRGQRLVTS